MDSIEDKLTRHQIWLQRYSGGLYKNEVLPLLKEMRDRILLKLQTDITEISSKRLEIILNDIDLIIQNGTYKINPSLWQELATYENEYSVKLLDDATVPSVVIGTGLNPAALTALTAESTVKMAGQKAMTIDDMVKTFSDRYYKDVKSEIQMGIASGDTLQQITKRVNELSNSRTRQQAEAVVRTVSNHISNSVRQEVFSEYNHLFKGKKWVSTLDSRTSPICMARDGKIYPLNNHPDCPAHWNCRSQLIDQVKDEYSIMGKDGTRSSSDGYMPASATYNDWLKRQSKTVQDEILGKKRAEAWRLSGDDIGRFVDKSGKFYSLDDLRKKDLLGEAIKEPIKKLSVPKISFGYDGKFDKYVEDIRDEAKIVIDKLPKPYEIKSKGKNKGSYYLPDKKIIDGKTGSLIARDEHGQRTFIHEYGHHIDYNISKNSGNGVFTIQRSMDKDFIEARSKDIEHIKDTYKGKNIFKELSEKWKGKEEFAGSSDIFDSIAGGKFQRAYGMPGHGVRYYKRTENKMAETFAQLFEGYANGGETWDNIVEHYPNQAKLMEQIISEAIK